MPAWCIAGPPAGWVGQDNNGELQSLGLVHCHQPNALGAFLDDQGLVRLAGFGIGLKLLDEGAEG